MKSLGTRKVQQIRVLFSKEEMKDLDKVVHWFLNRSYVVRESRIARRLDLWLGKLIKMPNVAKENPSTDYYLITAERILDRNGKVPAIEYLRRKKRHRVSDKRKT